jgi:hypothetical protein
MVIAIGISALIGGALGLRWNVFILIPAIILAALGTAVVGAASGDEAWLVGLTIFLVAAAIQIISVSLVDYVDGKVHLNKPSEKVVLEWKSAA